MVIKRNDKKKTSERGESKGKILDKEPYSLQTSMQTKQSRQKALWKKRRNLNNGFIDLRHVVFIRES